MRSNHPFRSRFDGADGLFPLRQQLRCRDEMGQRLVLSTVQTGFIVALVLMAVSMHRMFVSHGALAAGWVEPLAQAAVLIVVLLTLRRVVLNVREIIGLRTELQRLKSEVDRMKDEA